MSLLSLPLSKLSLSEKIERLRRKSILLQFEKDIIDYPLKDLKHPAFELIPSDYIIVNRILVFTPVDEREWRFDSSTRTRRSCQILSHESDPRRFRIS